MDVTAKTFLFDASINKRCKYIINKTSSILENISLASQISLLTWSRNLNFTESNPGVFGHDFEHYLSKHSPRFRKPKLINHSIEHEESVVHYMTDDIFDIISNSYVAFINFIMHLHFVSCNTKHGIRKQNVLSGDAKINPDFGRYLYPKHSSVDTLLNDLYNFAENSFTNINQSKSKLLEKAIIFYVNFLSIHPFEDGNGRVARLIFNLMLKKIFSLNAYIPLSAFSSISSLGITYYIREVQLFNKWDGFIKIIYNIAKIYSLRTDLVTDKILISPISTSSRVKYYAKLPIQYYSNHTVY